MAPSDQPATPSRTRRRRDPDARKREVIEAAERVIAARGLEGMTHRAVAEEGGIPVASTTYHFATRDDLIQLAFERSVDDFAAYLDALDHEQPLTTLTDLVDQLTDAVVTACTTHRARSVLQYELFLAALRRPHLRPIANRDIALGRTRLEQMLPPNRAAAVSALMAGLILHGMVGTTPPDRDHVHAALADACHLGAASDASTGN
ncbi:TetR/AcrR family transcriptional regulator [Streptomyces sp. NPDC001591]|uniref:TetR/AcrR family transcriptional regulator n=1 Tax=Streptomyces sp. NPDC001591 TaxID=3364589 RepID=UPI0036AC429E